MQDGKCILNAKLLWMSPPRHGWRRVSARSAPAAVDGDRAVDLAAVALAPVAALAAVVGSRTLLPAELAGADRHGVGRGVGEELVLGRRGDQAEMGANELAPVVLGHRLGTVARQAQEGFDRLA